MKKPLSALLLALPLVAGAIALAGRSPASGAAADATAVARGEYLVKTMGCWDCHTPHLPDGEPDRDRWLSGHPETLEMPPAPELPEGPWRVAAAGTLTAWSGPWGTSFTANLTPDVETGLGSWSFEQFRETVTTGRHLGRGRPILPPMPWFNVAALTDADLRALWAYLRSIPAISNRVPEPLPPAE